jgi:hypothetical protein
MVCPQQSEAKQALLRVLAEHQGDAKAALVQPAIARLVDLSDHTAPAEAAELAGNWRLLSAPNFPDGQQTASGKWQYTLGRLAFDMFRPQDLPVQLTEVFQEIQPLPDGSQQTHNIVVHFQATRAGLPPVQGVVRNLGVCQPADPTALQVQFTGGVLEPAPNTDADAWQQVLHSTKQTSASLRDRCQQLALKLIFGLGKPQTIDPQTGRAEFAMPRSPKGRLNILYLDDTLRIMQSQKEQTLMICERV